MNVQPVARYLKTQVLITVNISPVGAPLPGLVRILVFSSTDYSECFTDYSESVNCIQPFSQVMTKYDAGKETLLTPLTTVNVLTKAPLAARTSLMLC